MTTHRGAPSAAHASGTASVDREALDGITRYVEAVRGQWSIPGVALTIVKDDAVVMTRGFGVREAGKSARVDERTIFALSSMGKAFAAAAVATQVDDGRLNWDDPIVEHLPWFQLSDPWVTPKVTVRDCLSHKSGIGDETWGITTAPRHTLLRRARYMSQASQFRTSYDYSNIGITIAGEAAAAAAGTDWHTLINDRLLRPLSMKASTTNLSALWKAQDIAPCYLGTPGHTVGIEDSLLENIVMPHVWQDGKFQAIAWRTVDNIAPGGSINSNAVDMAQWLRMNLARGEVDGRRVLSERVVQEMHTPQNVIPPQKLPIGPALTEAEDRFHFWAYGLGWRMTDYRGRKIIMHTGGITGFSSIMVLLPAINLGISVLTNGWRSPDLFVYAIILRIADVYLGAEPEDWGSVLWERAQTQRAAEAETVRRFEQSRIRGTSASFPLTSYTGRYGNPAYDVIELEVRDGRLHLGLPGALSVALEHWHYDTFRVHAGSLNPHFATATVTFDLDAQHQIAGLEFAPYGKFERLEH